MTPVSWHPIRRSRWKRISIIGTLAAVLSVVGLLGSGGVAAQAATTPTSGTTTIHFTVKMHPVTRPGEAVPLQDEEEVNYCTMQVNNPHNSTHVPGQVNVTGGMTCAPYPVEQSDLSLGLYYDGEEYGYDDSYLENVYENPVQANADCIDGTWSAEIDFWIYFGPTWVPDTWDSSVESGPFDLTC